MMFIVRTTGDWRARWPDDAHIRVALVRRTPDIVPGADGLTDLFCLGGEDAVERLQAAGWTVVAMSDGWYQDDHGGGVAIWGQGAYWEIRDTPFTVTEASGPATESDPDGAGETLDVRRGIFGV